MIKTGIYVLITLAVLGSCKKDKLEGDRSILEGKWEWVYSIKTTSYLNGTTALIDTITPAQVTSMYELEFLKKGRFQLIENGDIKDDYRIVFTNFESGGINCMGSIFNSERFYYSIHADNDENNRFEGCVSSDSLTCYSRDFPFSYYKGSGMLIIYENFFKKVN